MFCACALMNHFYSFIKNRSITSDRNHVSKWVHSNENRAELFSIIVQGEMELLVRYERKRRD